MKKRKIMQFNNIFCKQCFAIHNNFNKYITKEQNKYIKIFKENTKNQAEKTKFALFHDQIIPKLN